MADTDGLIPRKRIWLSHAYEHIFRAITLDWEKLENDAEEKLGRDIDPSTPTNADDCQGLDEAHKKAAARFHKVLADGELIALTDDPIKGERQISPAEWTAHGYIPGFIPGDFALPGGRIWDPVYFDLDDFERWLERHFPATKTKQGGRKPGFDWQDIEQFVFKTMEERGDFDSGWQAWRGPADLHRLICQYQEQRNEKAPEKSVLYSRIPKIIERWRAKNSAS
jgi:hypothetical protein